MQVLIEFSLVRGNLGGIFKVLSLLYGMYEAQSKYSLFDVLEFSFDNLMILFDCLFFLHFFQIICT